MPEQLSLDFSAPDPPAPVRKTYRYRLVPTRRQAEALGAQLAEACRLYNAALEERRDA